MGLLSIAFVIEFVLYIVNSVVNFEGKLASGFVKKHAGDSTASNTPSLSSSISEISIMPSLSVSKQLFIAELTA